MYHENKIKKLKVKILWLKITFFKYFHGSKLNCHVKCLVRRLIVVSSPIVSLCIFGNLAGSLPFYDLLYKKSFTQVYIPQIASYDKAHCRTLLLTTASFWAFLFLHFRKSVLRKQKLKCNWASYQNTQNALYWAHCILCITGRVTQVVRIVRQMSHAKKKRALEFLSLF